MDSMSNWRNSRINKVITLDLAPHRLDPSPQADYFLGLIIQHHGSLYSESWVEVESGVVVFDPREASDAGCFFCGYGQIRFSIS